MGDLLAISNDLAAPLTKLFAFLDQGHPQCAFVDKQLLSLYASPRFWQYGLLAFCSECCAANVDQMRRAAAAKENPEAQQDFPTSDVGALSLMQTVIMSFVRGMTHGQQELPIDDLFVHFPVQVLPSLVQSITDNGFSKTPPKNGLGYRPNVKTRKRVRPFCESRS